MRVDYTFGDVLKHLKIEESHPIFAGKYASLYSFETMVASQDLS